MTKPKDTKPDSGELRCSLSRSMDELETATLRELKRFDGVPVRCGYLGDRVFDELIRAKGHHNGSAPFARIQGKIMKRLEKKGLAMVVSRNDRWGWVLTESGRQRVQ